MLSTSIFNQEWLESYGAIQFVEKIAMTWIVRITCPKCRTAIQFDARRSRFVQQRERELDALAQTLRAREQLLRVRDAAYANDVRLVRSCLHPDRHPEEGGRYTRAWQAFERLRVPAPEPFDDEIPF
jgi:hypothetical protein